MTYQAPDENGFYGKFGGRFVPETLMKAVKELDEAYRASKTDPAFQQELNYYLKEYVGRECCFILQNNSLHMLAGRKFI